MQGQNLECNVIFMTLIKSAQFYFQAIFVTKKNELSNSRVCSVILSAQPLHLNYLRTESLRVVYILTAVFYLRQTACAAQGVKTFCRTIFLHFERRWL